MSGKRKTSSGKSAKSPDGAKPPARKRTRSASASNAARTGAPAKRPRNRAPANGANAVSKQTSLELDPNASALPFAEMSAEDSDTELETELGLGAGVVGPHVRFESELSSPSLPPTPTPPPAAPDFEAQIRALEARLDGLIRASSRVEAPAAVAVEPDPAPQPPVVTASAVAVPAANEAAVAAPVTNGQPDSVTAAFVEKQWGREALRNLSEEVDDFGFDPGFENRVRPGIDLLYRHYFRVEVDGAHNVPSTGRGIVVANHSGTLPLDGLVLRAALRLDHPSGRDLRWLAEDFHFYLPFAGVFLNRLGAVRACPENAERLLQKDSLVAVFPEGVHGIKKLFRDRYRLQRFGRGGYIRLCLRTRTPLIPCAIIGAEEANPLLFRFERIAELFRLPYLPVTPTFPLLGPLGLLPAPTRWKIRFGEPISFDSYGPQAADDTVLVGRLSERVRSSIQGLLDTGLRARKSIWFG